MSEKKKERLYEILPTCPFCGYKEKEWGEIFSNGSHDEIIECGECGIEYSCYLKLDPTFNSYELEESK